MRIIPWIDVARDARIIRIMMNATTGYGKALRKCGGCDKHVATKLALDGMETFVVHLDRGYLCQGSGNIVVAGREFLASVVAKEVR